MVALKVSRAFRHRRRNSSTDRAIVSSTSAAVAVSGTVAIVSRAVREKRTVCGAKLIKGRRLIQVSPVDTGRMFRYERRSVSFGVNHRHGWPAKDGRPSMRRRWQVELDEEGNVGSKVNRSSALPSWSVSRKPSRYWARDVSFSRQSSEFVDFRAARRSPPKSGAIGNQFIFIGSLLYAATFTWGRN